jgi:alkylmercury lyase
MTNTRVTQSTSELTKPGGPLDLGPAAWLLVQTLRLLAHGQPVTADQAKHLVAELGIDPEQAHEFLSAWTETSPSGDIVGLGLTLNPTPHRFTVDGIQLWTWCAGDTLIFPILLNRPAIVESRSPSPTRPSGFT